MVTWSKNDEHGRFAWLKMQRIKDPDGIFQDSKDDLEEQLGSFRWVDFEKQKTMRNSWPSAGFHDSNPNPCHPLTAAW